MPEATLGKSAINVQIGDLIYFRGNNERPLTVKNVIITEDRHAKTKVVKIVGPLDVSEEYQPGDMLTTILRY